MKKQPLKNTPIDLLSFLSLLLFLISADHITAPLGMLFLLSVFQEISFIGVCFGVALIAFIISAIAKAAIIKIIIRLLYLSFSLACIIAICFVNISMFQQLPSLISLIVYSIFTILSVINWITHLIEDRKYTLLG